MQMNPIEASKIKVAIVEDDSTLRGEIAFHLKEIGFTVFELNNGNSLYDLLTHESINIIILDLNLPGEDGIQIATKLRSSLLNIGLIMLSARSGLIDKLKGYESGADVYLSKPVSAEELVATMLSVHQRIKSKNLIPNWVLNSTERSIQNNETSLCVHLTNHEELIMLGLIQAKDQTLTNENITDMMAKEDSLDFMNKRSIETMISRLRKKLSSISNTPEDSMILSVWGVGYKLSILVVKTPI